MIWIYGGEKGWWLIEQWAENFGMINDDGN